MCHGGISMTVLRTAARPPASRARRPSCGRAALVMAQRLLNARMPSVQDTAGLRHPRSAWDAPARSTTQERFFRELMGARDLPSPPEVAQRMLVTVNRDDVRVDELSKLIARDQ